MNIAEMFITLGIKGDDKASKQIKSVDGGLKEIASSGLAAKAAIVAAVYALERMMSQSAKAGLGISQFASYTGLSADQLQRWQYMFKRSGVSAEEVTTSLQQMQAAIVKWKMGDEPPRGLAVIANKLKDLDLTRLEDANYLMGKLREYAQKESNVGFANQMLESMGLTPQAISALRTSKVELDKISSKNLYSDKEVSSLTKVQEMWSDLGDKVEHAFGKFTAKHGADFVKGISMITDKVIILAEKLSVLGEKIKLFHWLGEAFKGIGMLSDLGSATVDYFSDIAGGGKKGEKRKEEAGMFFKDMWNSIKAMGIESSPAPALEKKMEKSVTPTIKTGKGQEGASVQTINVNQSLAFNSDGENAVDVGDIHQRAVEKAFRLTFSQGMAT